LPLRYARQAPDFAALAERQPLLRPFLLPDAAGGRPRLDFSDFGSTRALTSSLLKEDFGITWWLPDGHLCPTLTSRLSYLHWVEDLLPLLPGTPAAARGVDVGTGASCIYALLGAALNGWSFVATDVAPEALCAARRTVAANPHLRSLVDVRDASGPEPGGRLFAGVLLPHERFSFSVCNPPFFSAPPKAGRNRGADCGGTDAELVTPGGEAAFLRRMVLESKQPEIASAVRLFTSLCGRKQTLREMRSLLVELRAPLVRTQALSQGRTARWALAWSWEAGAQAAARAPLAGREAAVAPAHRASATLRVPRSEGAAAVLSALHALLCRSAAEALVLDGAAFSVRGALRCAMEDDAAVGDKRGRADEGGDGSLCPFSAALTEHAPGGLTLAMSLRGGAAAPQEARAAFGALAREVVRELGRRWPSG
jgi:23S rRNA (adenine1618-N6)-methyltransferase